MAQEPYDETEYQFNEGDTMVYDQEKGEDQPPAYGDIGKKSKKGSAKRTFFLLIIGIIVIFVAYKGSSFLLSGKSKVTSRKVSSISRAFPVVKPKPSTKVAKKVTKVTAPSVEAKKPLLTPVKKVEEVKKPEKKEVIVKEVLPDTFKKDVTTQISKLQEGSTQLVEELRSHKGVTQDRLLSVQERVSKVQSSIDDLRDVVERLSSQLKRKEAAARMQKMRQIQARKAREKKMRDKKLYFVEAVIPGRAWLRGMDGSAFTVAVGDQIKGYGEVISINSYSGTVTTSSGVKIYYGIDG